MYFPIFFLVIASSVSVRFEPFPSPGEVEERVGEDEATLVAEGAEGGSDESESLPMVPIAAKLEKSRTFWDIVSGMCSRDRPSPAASVPEVDVEQGLVPLPLPSGDSFLSLDQASEVSSLRSFQYEPSLTAQAQAKDEDCRTRVCQLLSGRACQSVLLLGGGAVVFCYQRAGQREIDRCSKDLGRDLQNHGCFLSASPVSTIRASSFCRSVAEKALKKCPFFAARSVRRFERRQEEGWRRREEMGRVEGRMEELD